MNSSKAPRNLGAIQIALWTGQRQGDLLQLKWADYHGTHIRLKQSKTGIRVHIHAGASLRLALDAEKAAQVRLGKALNGKSTILITLRNTAWTESGFRASWRRGCIAAGISDVTFHDLRGTAATRLAKAGCTVPEIATITGHSHRDVGTILDSHYLNRDHALGESASGSSKRRPKHPT